MIKQRGSHLEEMRANPEDRRHGTLTGYKYGCRCDRCREANSKYAAGRREYMREYRRRPAVRKRHAAIYEKRKGELKIRRMASAKRHLADMTANSEDRRHGTLTGYTYGCRCDRCREANRDYNKKRRS